MRARALACRRGHPFTPENTKTDRDGSRKCRRCNAEQAAARRAAAVGRPDLPVLRPPEWMAAALCAQTGEPDAWFPDAGRGDMAALAKRVCQACPVRAECLRYALALPANPDGVWGGLSMRERAELRKVRRQDVAA